MKDWLQNKTKFECNNGKFEKTSYICCVEISKYGGVAKTVWQNKLDFHATFLSINWKLHKIGIINACK